MYQQNLNYRIAEETQLLAEEKWIIEALKKIKSQRNSLQIERLHLESLRTKLRINKDTEQKTEKRQVLQDVQTQESTKTMTNLMMQMGPLADNERLYEENCNEEELNLNVSNPCLSVNQDTFAFMEEEEEDDCEDVAIDMNMFMNGEPHPKSHKTKT